MKPNSTKINTTAEIKTTHYDNGEVMSETPYVDGKKHGVYAAWYENGQKLKGGMFRIDKPHGMENGWHKNGSKWLEKNVEVG